MSLQPSADQTVAKKALVGHGPGRAGSTRRIAQGVMIPKGETRKSPWVNYNDLTRPNSPQMVVCVGNSPPPNHLISGWRKI